MSESESESESERESESEKKNEKKKKKNKKNSKKTVDDSDADEKDRDKDKQDKTDKDKEDYKDDDDEDDNDKKKPTGKSKKERKTAKKGHSKAAVKKQTIKQNYSDENLEKIFKNPAPPIPLVENPKPFEQALKKCSIHEIPNGKPKVGHVMTLPSKNVYLNGIVVTVGIEFDLNRKIDTPQDLTKIARYIQPAHFGLIKDEKGAKYRFKYFIYQGERCWFLNSPLINHIDSRFRNPWLLKNEKNYDFNILCHFNNRYANGLPMIADDVYYRQNKLATTDPVNFHTDSIQHRLTMFERKRATLLLPKAGKKGKRKKLKDMDTDMDGNTNVSRNTTLVHAIGNKSVNDNISFAAGGIGGLGGLGGVNARLENKFDMSLSQLHSMASGSGSGSGHGSVNGIEIGGADGMQPRTEFTSTTAIASLISSVDGQFGGESKPQFVASTHAMKQAGAILAWFANNNANSEEKIQRQVDFAQLLEKIRAIEPIVNIAMSKSCNHILEIAQHSPQIVMQLIEPFKYLKSTHDLQTFFTDPVWCGMMIMHLIQMKSFDKIRPLELT